MLPTLTSKYHTPFEQTLCEDSDSTGSETGLVGEKRRTSPKHSKRDANNAYSRKSISFIIVALILGFCSGIAGAGLFIYINADRACLQLQSTYSPVLQDIPARLATVRFNGSLDYPSEYRGAPSLQVDGAWDKMTKVKIISVSESDVIKSGSTKDAVRVPEEFGGGYMATLEITHQLHCLNFLRMASHWDYYQYKAVEFSDEPSMVRTHLDHCIEMLRQVLMCNADTGIIIHHWVKGLRRPYPNFNVVHKCRNLDAVMLWSRDHKVQSPPGYRFSVQPGDKIFDSPP